MIFVHAVLLLMYYLDTSVAEDVDSTGDPALCGTVKTADGGHHQKIGWQMMPSTLLSGSATEFDLQCEADDENPAKRRRDDSTAVVVDSLSGGVLMTSTASSFNSGADITDTNAMLKTGSATGNEVCNEVLPLLKHRKNYNAKASHKVCVGVFVCSLRAGV